MLIDSTPFLWSAHLARAALLRTRLLCSRSLVSRRKWLSSFPHSGAVRHTIILVLLSGGLVLSGRPVAWAQTVVSLTNVLTFNNTNGGIAPGKILPGRDGNLYGLTYGYGNSSEAQGNDIYGTVFKLTPEGVFTTLYAFTDGSDGGNPGTVLVQGSDGNFYGTTVTGGDYGNGTIFKITPEGVVTAIYSFSNGGSYSPLVEGDDGNFYGTSSSNGLMDSGMVFKITPTGVFTTLYNFTGLDDGYLAGDLVAGGDGNFYGTTRFGGACNGGTVFKITPAGVLTTLYDFTGGSDGEEPSSLLLASDGNFYGTTSFGAEDYGTVFKITPAGVLTTIYTFGSMDSLGPDVTLDVQASDGSFYGTSFEEGVVFKITPAGVLTILYFSVDLYSPAATEPFGLVQGSDGNYYGTTMSDGNSSFGTIFKLAVQPSFFTGEVALAENVYYLAFPNGNDFNCYSFLSNPGYIFHFDLGYEYVFDANDGLSGVYLYDFASNDFFYTSPTFPFPYLYDFNLESVLYYYSINGQPGHYTTNPRSFYDFATGQVITK